MFMLEVESRSSGRAACALNCKATSLSPPKQFWNDLSLNDKMQHVKDVVKMCCIAYIVRKINLGEIKIKIKTEVE